MAANELRRNYGVAPQETMLFIAHQLPKALQVDAEVRFGGAESVQGAGAETKGPV